MATGHGIGLVAVALLVSACASYPELPADLQGKVAIVMGFDTDTAKPYEGGMLYTGLVLESINEQPLSPALGMYQYRLVEPGQVSVGGHCFWRLRGLLWDRPDDLWEPGQLSWQAEPNHVYTLSAAIDEYQNRCEISLFDRPPNP